MMNIGKLLVVLNFMLAILFLSLALMVKATQADLPKQVSEARSEASKLGDRLKDLKEKVSKNPSESGIDYWDKEVRNANFRTATLEKEINGQADNLRQEISTQRKQLADLTDRNVSAGGSELKDKLLQQKDLREKVEAAREAQKKAKKENDDNEDVKRELTNQNNQAAQRLSDVKARLAGMEVQLKEIQDAAKKAAQ